jgi:hypothetical protein
MLATAPRCGAVVALQCYSPVSTQMVACCTIQHYFRCLMWKNLWIALANPVKKSKFILLPKSGFFWYAI